MEFREFFPFDFVLRDLGLICQIQTVNDLVQIYYKLITVLHLTFSYYIISLHRLFLGSGRFNTRSLKIFIGSPCLNSCYEGGVNVAFETTAIYRFFYCKLLKNLE